MSILIPKVFARTAVFSASTTIQTAHVPYVQLCAPTPMKTTSAQCALTHVRMMRTKTVPAQPADMSARSTCMKKENASTAV